MGIALHLPKQRGHIIMKFFILAALAALAAADPLVERYHAKEFSTFMNKFGKSYATSEESKLRFDIFKANVQKMHAHNSRKDVSWKMGINQFSDLTDEEFEAVHLGGYKQTPMPAFRPATLKSKDEINIKDLPESVNWCDKGACTPVKDQGSCGSCWAFATTAVIESHMHRHRKLAHSVHPASDFLHSQSPQVWRNRRMLWIHPPAWIHLHPALRTHH